MATRRVKNREADIRRNGCIPCMLQAFLNARPEIHHLVEQAERRGDLFSYGLCAWHHRGICWDGMSSEEMRELLGPSMRLESKAYHERYGSEMTLLRVQNYALELFTREPWGDYDMPRHVARKIRKFWRTESNSDQLLAARATTRRPA